MVKHMNDKKTCACERRKQARYPVKKEVYAVLKPDYDMMGPILDISRGGLAFNYCPVSCQTETAENVERDIELSIITETDAFFLKGLKINIVSDVEINEHCHNEQKLRRCGLQFEEPRVNRQNKLEHVIQQLKQLKPFKRSK